MTGLDARGGQAHRPHSIDARRRPSPGCHHGVPPLPACLFTSAGRGARAAIGRRRDRGSATVWVLACGLVLVLAGLAGAAVGAARVARHQAKVAADLGALAGAMRAIEGAPAACARAADLAAANHARLTGCRVDGLDVVTTTAVSVTLLTGFSGTATATSRAGPIR